MVDTIGRYRSRATAFEELAHEILATQESSKSRVISLYETLNRLDDLSLEQDEQFRHALQCIEQGIYKAAFVMAWAGFMDFLEGKLSADDLKAVHAVRPSWAKYSTIETLREYVPEYQLIDVAHAVKLLTKTDVKALHGALSRRNECAHPNHYQPGLNESLGYVSELLNRIELLIGRELPT